MKLPRWLVILMLTSSVLAVLAAAGWWWVTWPERTARQVVEAMIESQPDWGSEYQNRRGDRFVIGFAPNRLSDVKPLPRSISDLACGRCRYKVYSPELNGVWWLFTVERGFPYTPQEQLMDTSETGGYSP